MMYTGIVSQKQYCPYCAERIELLIDNSEAHQSYIEDCQVCCRPIRVDVLVDGNELHVSLYAENE